MIKKLLATLFTLALITGTLFAQKKNLSPDDYVKWQSIGALSISDNGEWLAYQITVQEDNDTMFVVNRNTKKVYKLEFSAAPEFSKDNKWIAYRIGLPFKEAEKLRDDGKPIEYKMGLLNLQTGKKETIQNVSQFGFSRNGKFLTVRLAAPKDNKDKGSVLLLKNLSDSSTRTIGNVTEYSFNKKSDYLVYIVESANAAGNSVELFNLVNYSLKIIASDTLKFSKLSWQKEGDGFAFYKTYTKDDFEEDNAVVYSYINLYKAPVLNSFNPAETTGFPAGMRVFNKSGLSLSDDMSSVFFGIKSWTAKPKKEGKKAASDSAKAKTDSSAVKVDAVKEKSDTAKVNTAKKTNKDEKLPAVDIWHWKDPEIQPRQKVTYTQDKDASYFSVWNMDINKFYQLAKDSLPDARLTGNSLYCITSTNKKYKPAFKEDYADFYLVNVKTGEEKLLFEKIPNTFYTSPRSSPDGKYLAYFKDKHWWSYTISTKQHT